MDIIRTILATYTVSKKGHIFLSYAREDWGFVSELEQDLRNAGIEVWRDVSNIIPGKPWQKELKEALKGCVAFVPVLSPHYVNSDFCKNELFYAHVEGFPIIPIWYAPDNHVNRDQRYEMPAHVREYQAIHFYSGMLLKKFEGNKVIDVVDPVYDTETRAQALSTLIKTIDIQRRERPPRGELTPQDPAIVQLTASIAFQWIGYAVMSIPGMAGFYILCCYCVPFVTLGILAHAGYYWIVGQNLQNPKIKRLSIIAGASAIAGPVISFIISMTTALIFFPKTE